MPDPGSHSDQFAEFLRDQGLSFESSEWLGRALIHSSFGFERGLEANNERLEFLGDAVLATVVSEALFERFPRSEEGELTKMRARLVSRKELGRLGRAIDLGRFLKLGRGEDQSGGRQRASILGSAVEAVVGALYLEQGLEPCRRFAARFLLTEERLAVLHAETSWDAKSRLQELVQKRMQAVPEYRLAETEGPDHQRTFSVEVLIGGKVAGSGTGSRIKSAENAAAADALSRFQ